MRPDEFVALAIASRTASPSSATDAGRCTEPCSQCPSHHGEQWDPETQGLTAFLAANPEFEKRLVIVGENELHLIELAG